jgi:hypothetical protein
MTRRDAIAIRSARERRARTAERSPFQVARADRAASIGAAHKVPIRAQLLGMLSLTRKIALRYGQALR